MLPAPMVFPSAHCPVCAVTVVRFRTGWLVLVDGLPEAESLPSVAWPFVVGGGTSVL